MNYDTHSPPASAPPVYDQPPPVAGIPVQSPAGSYIHSSSNPGQWSTGLYDCCSDVPNCCMTCWCPCITFGQIVEIVDKGSDSGGIREGLHGLIACITGCGGIYSFIYRTKLRKQYLLPETPCSDFLVHCCCEPCALCQEYRELEHRGFDMSLGWDGNMEKQRQGTAMTVPSVGGMGR